MKRSDINRWLSESKEFMIKLGWHLPPFASWSYQDWHQKMNQSDFQTRYSEIFSKKLGWDLTDFGSNNFLHHGLTLFTIRNGDINSARQYAEKIMVQRAGQITPMHFHWEKAEDIINRGGGNLIIKLYHPAASDTLLPKQDFIPGALDKNRPIEYLHDGEISIVNPGTEIILKPGESITLLPRIYHSFWGQVDTNWVLVGEVSQVNDDEFDNRFLEELPRFAAIEEDEPPQFVLCNEYSKIQNSKYKK
jgi:D-lyxose ketol-isomerase